MYDNSLELLDKLRGVAVLNNLDFDTVKLIVSRLRTGTPAGLNVFECWPWQSSAETREKRGYGRICYTDRAGRRHSVTVNRAICALRGEAPFRGKGPIGRHRCDHGWCCNPDHVESGTQVQNMADMRARGRDKKNTGQRWTKVQKLTDDQVRAIRADTRPLAPVAEEFVVAISTVSRIRTGARKGLVPDAGPGLPAAR